jgi:para-aminobenzoate synthetase component 1
MLNWANRFNIFCFLDNHHYKLAHHSVECLLAVGSLRQLQCASGTALDEFHTFSKQENDWIFGHLGFDLKNETENMSSANEDHIQFPDLFFYIPEIIIQLSEEFISIGVREANALEVYKQIMNSPKAMNNRLVQARIQNRFSQSDYINVVRKLQQHILRGDCYEINFCQEFYDDNIEIDPLSTFWSLSKASPNPFSAFYRLHDKYLLCASPERYLKRVGDLIYSQPIKGTWQRDLLNKEKDAENKRLLQQSSKDRSENVMVVDLVRNDLSKVCTEGSVVVEELFGAYSFPQVHQLISTIKGTLKKGIELVDIIKASFPMGSMTGAPKRRVLELIEEYERTKRGLFSGALGYISPDGDFDFNVVIRSILYNSSASYLSFQTGSGITFYSDPESEYEECLLKAQAIKKVLTG